MSAETPVPEPFKVMPETIIKITYWFHHNYSRIAATTLAIAQACMADAELPLMRTPEEMLNIVALLEDIGIVIRHQGKVTPNNQTKEFAKLVWAADKAIRAGRYEYKPVPREQKRIITPDAPEAKRIIT